MTVDRNMAGKEAKKQKLIEQQRLRLEDLAEKEALDNAGLLDSADDSDLDSEDRMYKEAEREDRKAEMPMEGRDIESSGESDGEDGAGKGLFVNPLAKKTGKAEESEEWSDDDKYEHETGKKATKKKAKEKDTVLGKRKRKDSIDDVRDFFRGEAIEEVPANDPGTLAQQDGYESLDSDDIAATRILARKMLRKKARNDIIDASYNRYVTHEDPNSLPSWFVEDEAKHAYCERLQPTKEELEAEKEAIKAYNARPSKKVEQAKARKKKRLAKAMNKIKKKAQVIADQDINEASKMKQIQKLYRKEKEKHKEQKTYVLNRSFQASGPKKGGRLVKNVDARLRKDMRNEKFRARKNKGKRGAPRTKVRALVQKGGGRPKK